MSTLTSNRDGSLSGPPSFEGPGSGLWTALHRLDERLVLAIEAAQDQRGADALADKFRGLHLSLRDMSSLLAQEPGEPRFSLSADREHPIDVLSDFVRLDWLRTMYNLSATEVDILLVALAPEIDLRYERLFAYLQDDVSRRRPSVDLMLNLLCSNAISKLESRAYFRLEAPLIRHNLIHLMPDPHQAQPSPLLAHYAYVDEQIIRFLIGPEGLDSRLAPFCELIEPSISLADVFCEPDQKETLNRIAEQFLTGDQPMRLYFQGIPGSRTQSAGEALASATSTRFLKADLSKVTTSGIGFPEAIAVLLREARFYGATLFVEGLEPLSESNHNAKLRALIEPVHNAPGITILTGIQQWIPDPEFPVGMLTIAFPMPEFEARLACWQSGLRAYQLSAEADILHRVAARFLLTPGQIDQSVAEIASQKWQLGKNDPARVGGMISQSDLYRAARQQCSYELSKLTQKIEPHYAWEDIVLPDEALLQLQEICNWEMHRQQVIHEWGFGRKLSLGKGVNALFVGPSGTGKTMAAEVVAHELGLDLYKIDLSTVVSKYIGETEKNLDRIFGTAENANAILFFDEADALFGKRSEVRDSHDRYANLEISYLLQKMEQYQGISILATNLLQNLDDAFVRRMAFTIHFPFPDAVNRQRIWEGIWPTMTPLADDIDPTFLARQFKLSGGNIKNVALAAAYLAAGDGNVVNVEHLLQAIQREYQKMGKTLSATELYGEHHSGSNSVREGSLR